MRTRSAEESLKGALRNELAIRSRLGLSTPNRTPHVEKGIENGYRYQEQESKPERKNPPKEVPVSPWPSMS